MQERTFPETLVWDLPVRLFHWLLVLVLAGSWATQELGTAWMELHMALGYTALGLVLFRVFWGFAGTRHARFADFLTGPSAVVAYLRAWTAGSPPPVAGHNPAGGWSVLAMLLLVLGQAVTGFFNSDGALYAGPWHFEVSSRLAGIAKGLHHDLFYALVALSGLHVAAVLAYRWRPGVDLIGPMLNGRKRAPGPGIDGSRLGRALIVLMVAAGLVALAVALAPPPDPADLGIF